MSGKVLYEKTIRTREKMKQYEIIEETDGGKWGFCLIIRATDEKTRYISFNSYREAEKFLIGELDEPLPKSITSMLELFMVVLLFLVPYFFWNFLFGMIDNTYIRVPLTALVSIVVLGWILKSYKKYEERRKSNLLK
jgi:hypothetical protein